MGFRFFLLLIAALASSGAAPVSAAAGGHRWRAGYQVIAAVGHQHSPPRSISVWYPTPARERSYRTGPFSMRVAAGATAAEGAFPVIALSHGAFGRPLNHRDLAIALARAGYIVVAPQHDPDADAAGFGDIRQREGRPDELMSALRTVRSHPGFAAHFDARRVGAVGYSAGGYGVLAAMHARSNWSDVAGHCLLHFLSDRHFCTGGGGGQDRARDIPAGLPTPDSRANASAQAPPDLRIRAAVLLAPVAAVFSTAGLAAVRAPVRIYSARNDRKINSRLHGDWLYRALKAQGTPAELVTTHGGHHVFMSPFPAVIEADVGAAARDPRGVDRIAFQHRLAGETIAFFARTLPPTTRGAPPRRTARCGGCSR